MICSNSTTLRRKGQHLTEIERGKIAAWHASCVSNRQIAKRIGVASQIIHNEIRRGKVTQVKKIKGKQVYFSHYEANYAQNRYVNQRKNCHRPSKFSQVRAFLAFFVNRFKTKGFSPDVVVGLARKRKLFTAEEMVCTTTLYAYIDAQRLAIKNIDLQMKLVRRPTKKKP